MISAWSQPRRVEYPDRNSCIIRYSDGVVWLILCLVLGAACAVAAAEDESAFLKNVRQLTFEGKRSGEGYFSQDGKALIFQSEREPENRVKAEERRESEEHSQRERGSRAPRRVVRVEKLFEPAANPRETSHRRSEV